MLSQYGNLAGFFNPAATATAVAVAAASAAAAAAGVALAVGFFAAQRYG